MKKTYILLFLFTFSITFAFAQAGTWKMSPQAAALGVGPGLGDISWWSNSAGDVALRECYFNDEYVFSEDGTFQNRFNFYITCNPTDLAEKVNYEIIK